MKQPEVVELETRFVIGFGKTYQMSELGQIAQLWGVFGQRKEEIPEADTSCAYGVGQKVGVDGALQLHYVAGMASTAAAAPDGLERIELPGGKYLKFTHEGDISKLPATFDWIFTEGVPNSGLKRRDTPEFEYYDSRFKVDSDESAFDIFVPVE
ncbi:MAG: GyrI-like domain-containing protein [Acidobacteriota bacterium]